MRMFYDPEYAYAFGGNPFGRKRKKRKVTREDEMDVFEKFMIFNEWLKKEREGNKDKKDDKKPDHHNHNKKLDTTGLAMFMMVITFFGGQASMLYLYHWFLTLPK